MKKLILILSLLSITLLTNCESKSGNEITSADISSLAKDGTDETQFGKFGRHGRGFGNIFDQLNLTDAQKEEIKTITQEHREAMKEKYLELKGELSREEMNEVRKTSFEELKIKLETVLTPEQIAKLEELKAKHESGEFFQEKMNERLVKLTEELGLSEDQRTQLEELFQSKWEERKANRGEGRNGNGHKFNKEKRDEFHAAVEDILTEKQMEKFKELFNERFGKRGNGKGKRDRGRF